MSDLNTENIPIVDNTYVNKYGAGWEVSGAKYTPTKLGGVETDEKGNIKPIE